MHLDAVVVVALLAVLAKALERDGDRADGADGLVRARVRKGGAGRLRRAAVRGEHPLGGVHGAGLALGAQVEDEAAAEDLGEDEGEEACVRRDGCERSGGVNAGGMGTDS
jgi:hypothetical protein